MSALLRCFGKVERKKKRQRHHCCCKCDRKDDETDGKTFSKTLSISETSKIQSSCCERDADSSQAEYYLAIPASPTTPTVAPGGSPFFLDYESQLPGRSYMPVSKDDPHYNMNHPRRGKAIIFNFDRWDNTNIPNLELSPRLGSSKDKKDLARCLRKLDFEVEEHDNVKSQGDGSIWAIVDRVRAEDHSDVDCLVVAVMTHGEKNTVYMRDGTQIPINLVWEAFEANMCPTLAGKPKIFIVQACRGKQYDSGTKLLPAVRVESQDPQPDVTDASTFSYVIPNAADILVAFSCPLGHYSWRHPERGSWFIQAICKIFSQHAYDMDLQTLFTYVAREVALNYQSNTTSFESNNKKQVTSTSSTLIRTVRFKPKELPPHSSPPVPIAQEIATSENKEGTVTLNAFHLTRSEVILEEVESADATAEARVTNGDIELTQPYAQVGVLGSQNGENVHFNPIAIT